MRKRSVGLILIIAILFLFLAFELKYIEDSLDYATTDNSIKCEMLCAEEGKMGILNDGYCNCRIPITFSKRWTCFWNITPGKEKSITISDSSFDHSKRIPIYPSEVFVDKIDPSQVRNFAVSSVSKYPKSNDIATKVYGVYSEVADKISYVSDPVGEEYIAWPNETIESGGGDCDDYTILLASMYQAVGLKTTIVQVNNREYGHVYMIVAVGDTLNGFLEKYKKVLEDNTDMHGDIPFNFIIFGTDKEHCEGINRNLADGGDINSFNIIIDGTARDYPGSTNPSQGYDFIKFIPL